MNNALINIQNLSLMHGTHTVLSNINFKIDKGNIISLIGPNGAGKTSLLRAILGLETHFTGHIHKAPNLHIAYMPQQFTSNAHFPLKVGEFLNIHRKDQSDALLKRLSINTLMHRPLHLLSGGEKQRVLLARAVLQKPHVLILDEPTQGVDTHGQAELYNIIDEVRRNLNCGILMVSHDLHVVMAKTDHVLCLNTHICCHGHPAEVSKHPEYIALFGQAHADSLAIYNHHHDHHHDIHGHAHDGECSHD